MLSKHKLKSSTKAKTNVVCKEDVSNAHKLIEDNRNALKNLLLFNQWGEIHKIVLKGYKCYSDYTELELKPLTLLAGSNSSGKTSIMQPMLVMKQTLLSGFSPMQPLLINGPNVKFDFAKQMFSNNSPDQELSIGFCSKYLDIYEMQSFKYDDEFNLVLSDFNARLRNLHAKLNLSMSEDEIAHNIKSYIKMFDKYDEFQSSLHSVSLEALNFTLVMKAMIDQLDDSKPEMDGINSAKSESSLDFTGARYKSFLNVLRSNSEVVAFSYQTFYRYYNSICTIIHIPGYRGDSERYYPLSKYNSFQSPGVFNEYWAGVILDWQKTNKQEKIEQLRKDMMFLSIGSDIKATQVAQSIEVEIKPFVKNQSKTKEMAWINIADVGFGVSLVLPILVALITANEKQIVYIEQPELHLHPKAQHLLAELFVNAIERGVILVVETHSDIMLTGLLEQVAKGKLKPEQLGLNWFSRKRNGAVKITQAKVEKDGAYGDWPIDFDSVKFEANLSLFNAMENR